MRLTRLILLNVPIDRLSSNLPIVPMMMVRYALLTHPTTLIKNLAPK